MEIKEQKGSDPNRWGHSLQNAWPILESCLDAVDAKSIVEIGALAGDLTADLLAWADGRGVKVTAIDPEPKPELHELAASRPELEVVGEPSLEALKHVPIADVFVVDGDHNYYTVFEELNTIADRLEGQHPLFVLHDVCWPHGRRDTYYVPDRIPEQGKQEGIGGGGLFPGRDGLTPGALPYKWAAPSEGGPKNGVLTAAEDFVIGHPGFKLAVIPVFYGIGLIWPEDAPWAERLVGAIGMFDRHPTLEKQESNRVLHLAIAQVLKAEVWRLEKKLAAQESVLRALNDSSAFGLADRASHLRNRQGDSWKKQIEKVLALEGKIDLEIDLNADLIKERDWED